MKLLKVILPAFLLLAAGSLLAIKATAPAAGGDDKVVICHNGNSIEVAASALPAHLAHGDAVGACSDDCLGEPHPEIFCITLYDPVCGCDGNTYSNGCYAFAAGVLHYTPGACPGK